MAGAGGEKGAANRRWGRRLANALVALLCLGVIFGWAYFGKYQLEPGEAAVILRLGRYVRTVSEPGLKWHLPPPLESHVVMNIASIEREAFGYRAEADVEPRPEERLEAAMQTHDNNIVHLSFVVRYRIKDPFAARYRIASRHAILRDAAQAAVREVVGRTTIDGVLSEQRGEVATEAQDILQQQLDRYESGLEVLGVELLDAQPPPAVREAFDDVIAAAQDRSRAVNEAQGYANEVLPRARAHATEIRESARAYREAKTAQAQGEAERFRALAREYRKAPEVTRTRLYLETMEEVLPRAHKVIVDPGVAVLPYLPLGDGALPGVAAPAPRGEKP